MATAPQPTDAELAILQVLWKQGALTVRQVHEICGEKTGYTTTLKLLQIMTEKGLVARNEAQRAHVYRARIAEGDTQRRLLAGVLDKAFRGSLPQLVLQALASKRATPAELTEIKRIISRIDRKFP